MSVSRTGSTGSEPRRVRTSALKSGMPNPRDAIERREERAPAAPLGIEHRLPLAGDAIEAAASRPGLFHPSAFDEAAALEPIERRIQRRHVKFQRALGTLIDELGNLVAVAVALFQQRENQDFGAAFTELAVVGHMPT